jgi:Replication-relaxation
VIRPTEQPRRIGSTRSSPASVRSGRALQVTAERVFELVRHLTGRDREIALVLYDQQLLTTAQLQLLFFASRRRAQDRLLFLYRNRVVDRFFPPSPFGAGKPEAHWLLDEAGAILVAAMLGVERKQLGWRRRDDWASHPQLAHRLEANRFVTDLIAATLRESTIGVSAWYSSREAAARLGNQQTGDLRPDTGFLLDVPTGAIECVLEWDRGTETQARLTEKLYGYRLAEGRLRASESRNILFVVPGAGRVQTLQRAYAAFEHERERHRRREGLVNLDGRWLQLSPTFSATERSDGCGSGSTRRTNSDSRSPSYRCAPTWRRSRSTSRSAVAGAKTSQASGSSSHRCTVAATRNERPATDPRPSAHKP